MKITFPHMGNTYITAKAFLDDLGVEYIIPPFNNKKSLEIGTKYAPELACLPLKINIGNFIQAHEKGADTVLITGGAGPCRFGYYCEMHREILKDIGYEMDVITLDIPKGDISGFLSKIKRLSGGLNPFKLIRIVKSAVEVVKMVDELEKLTFKIRPREIKRGSTDIIYKAFQQKVMKADGSAEIKKLVSNTRERLLSIDTDKSIKPLRVGIVGEIYTTIDSHTNFYIESLLGNAGIEVDRSVTVSGWVIDHMIKKAFKVPGNMEYREAAKPYLGAMIGGHAQETVGNAVLYAKAGYDGVIQIYPLTCMPEIVAESILPSIERDLDIPILTLIIDEMTGEAGYLTRIEAYMDLLNKRKERKLFEGKGILSWN
jgi:predicted nucleotide-binding protein (sugar kinase/HSP70/actin superfamily)